MNPSNSVIIDPTNYPDWDDLLLSTPGYSFFHSSAWAKVLLESYGYTPEYFAIIDDHKFAGLVPIMEVNSFLTGKRGVSLPFTDYCDPICNGSIEFVLLFNQIIEFGRKHDWKYLELRDGSSLIPDSFSLNSEKTRNSEPLPTEASTRAGGTPARRSLGAGGRNDIPSLTYVGHVLDLSRTEGEIFANFRDSTKRNVKKAMKEDVRVKIDRSLESVKAFYRLNCMTRREHGLPPQPFHFFKKVYDHVISKNLGMVVLAYHDQEAIAGAVYFHFGEKAVFKYGASDKKFQHLRANNLVMLEAIRRYSQDGYKSLCFGRTEPENHGLIQFKSGWGPIERPICYYRYDFGKSSFVSGSSKVVGIHNRVFRNLPISISNKIGALLYRHVG